jgi:hypothetical protein
MTHDDYQAQINRLQRTIDGLLGDVDNAAAHVIDDYRQSHAMLSRRCMLLETELTKARAQVKAMREALELIYAVARDGLGVNDVTS